MSDVRSARPDVIAGLITTALGVFWLWQAGHYGYLAEGGRLAAGTLPAVAGLVMAVCGAVIAISAVLRLRQSTATIESDEATLNLFSDDDQPSAAPSDHGDRKALLLFACLIVCLLGVPLIGFAFAFAILTFVIVRFFERRSLVASASTAAGVWATSYLLFELLFKVPLP